MRFAGFANRGRNVGHNGGAVAVYVALVAAATFGIVGLAIDAARAMTVHSESQAAADAAALAGASQLDGTSTAITRANAAIANLVANNQRMAGTGAGAVTIASTVYLSSLPASDDTAIGAGFVTTDPLQAHFVQVTTTPLEHDNSFLRAVGVLPSTMIATTAVAGNHIAVCGAQPIMMCNPNNTVGAGFDGAAWRGRQVILDFQANSWTSGNFGFLASGGNGASVLSEALASTAGANICYGPTVTTEPGQNNGARTALNTRFDMYENPMFGGNSSNNPLYAPDVNVRKGIRYTNSNCNNSTTNANGVLPRDANLIANPSQRFGNGVWNCLSYWNANFSSAGAAPAGCTAATSGFSRYDMYNYEISHNLVGAAGAGNEVGTPMCHGNSNPAQAGRRIIRVAVLNCAGGLSGRTTATPVTFVDVFLTEPVSDTPTVQIIGEIENVVSPGADDSELRQMVQIYR